MKEFVLCTACNGHKPSITGPMKHIERPHIIKKLMSNRDVARFIVASKGFGKTRVAYEYAQEMFNFFNTYWVDASSPRFLRDLDSGTLCEFYSTVGKDRSLVVFDELPFLDEKRAKAFSEVINAITKRGWEVIVTVIPLYDTFSQEQPSRVYLSARDLVLTEMEIEGAQAKNTVYGKDLPGFNAARIPSVAWGSRTGFSEFIQGLRVEEMPYDLQLAIFVMLVLQSGSTEDLAFVMRPLKRDTQLFLQSHYPFLGIDPITETFDACTIDIESLVDIFRESFFQISEASSIHGNSQLMLKLSDILMQNNRLDRASDIVVYACSRHKRAAWIEQRQDLYHSRGALRDIEKVALSMGDHPAHVNTHFLLGVMFRKCLFADYNGLSLAAYRVFNTRNVPAMELYIASLMCIDIPDIRIQERAHQTIKELEQMRLNDRFTIKPKPEHALIMSLIGMVFRGEFDDFCKRVRNNFGMLVVSDMGFMVLSFALHKCQSLRMLHLVHDMLCFRAANSPRCVLYEALLRVQFMHCLEMQDIELFEFPEEIIDLYAKLGTQDSETLAYPSERDDDVRDIYADYMLQCSMSTNPTYQPKLPRALVNETSQNTLKLMKYTPAAYTPPAAIEQPESSQNKEQEMIPQLYIRLFGGMEVTIGGKVVDPSLFTKQKSKTLLAILAMNLGHEVPRQMLLDSLWPNLVDKGPINNFYSMWSILRKALTIEDGSCPYLVRHQASCMLDARYVQCDVSSFNELCRVLMMGENAAKSWPTIYMDLESTYAGELLPSEVKNEYIVRMRESYHERIVDALVSASRHMCVQGEYQTALWFSRSAMSKDPSREDVYRALLEAQALSGQKSEAIETYVRCCTFMKDNYGVGPSKETIQLYEGLVLNIDDSVTEVTTE